MANYEVKTKIYLRNDTAANWTSANPTLGKGEIGIEIDTNRMKIGNGTTNWNSSDYYGDLIIADSSTSGKKSIVAIDSNGKPYVNSEVSIEGDSINTNKINNIAIEDFIVAVGGKIPTEYLPGFVDDVVEFSSRNAFPTKGESGKIYVAIDANKPYRWSGTTYVGIGKDIELGTTSETAFPGDRGLALENNKQDRLTAGEGISISGGVIKTINKQNKLTAGSGISISSNNVIEVVGKQDTLIAGEGISIQNNVISINYPNGDDLEYGG